MSGGGETSGLGPTPERERIASLDVLRGFALLGILVMNIQSFSMIAAAYMNPTAFGDLEGANRVVWLFSHVLADQKFMTIFSALFGAGVLLMSRRAEERGRGALGIHVRRMGWLLVIGLLHAYGLWYGDILVYYAICGVVVYPFRRLSPRWLTAIGIGSIGIASLLSCAHGWSLEFADPAVIEENREEWLPGPETQEAEIASFRGGWIAQMSHRAPFAFVSETLYLLGWGLWRAGGLMLIGMALFKLGFLGGDRSRRFYAVVAVLCIVAGIAVVAAGVRANVAADWDMLFWFMTGGQYNYWGSLLVSLGYGAGIVFLWKLRPDHVVFRVLASVGRLALTNYILQTVICTTLFYGHGLGLFGSVSRVGQVAVVAAVWVVQVAFSLAWLRRFRLGPLEWAWRSLTYWTLQPLRRRA